MANPILRKSVRAIDFAILTVVIMPGMQVLSAVANGKMVKWVLIYHHPCKARTVVILGWEMQLICKRTK
jgi:hypothetical protein